MADELHSVYRQLNETLGTTEPVRELLRDIQSRSDDAKSEINVSGSKEDAIRNLKLAVNKRFATFEEVQQLLWDIEETGRQHILLLTPAPADLATPNADVDDSTAVAAALFDEQVTADIFPRFEYPTEGYLWSDFRVLANGGWIAKAYGREVYRERQGTVEVEELDDGTIQETRQYAWKEVKATLVARWRPVSKILELRVDVSHLQTDKTVADRFAALWRLLEPAFGPNDFIGVHVDRLLERIIFERDTPENRKCYSISRVELTDPRSGQVRVIPKGSDELDKDPGRKASLAAMQKNDFKPSMVRVDWKPTVPEEPHGINEPVSSVLEKTDKGPELRILKKISNATHEYVFNQLRSRL